ncbi:MAG: DUF4272 domain-containing protein [Planctomycetes bacterium]|nr:DUF4272 domain-containing protein [Planctomycetota bacterium]
MTDLATILSPRADEPTAATFRGCAGGDDAGEDDGAAEVAVERPGPGVLRVRVVWPDLAVTCDVAGAGTEVLRRRLSAALAYVREMSTDPADPVAARVAAARQVLEWRVDPGFDDEGRAERLLLGVARDRGGVVLRTGRVLEPGGACLLAPPPPPPDDDVTPPTAARVVRRALALCAVVWRASLEQEKGRRRAERLHADLLAWLDARALTGELEGPERALVAAPIGALTRQRAIDASWRSEGLAVLGWALEACALPPHDEQADPHAATAALGFLDDGPAPALAAPRLRPAGELSAAARRLGGVHWRLRAFMQRPRALDLRAAAATAGLAPADLDGLPLLEGDLALRGAPIGRADPDVVGECASIAVERLRAMRWLLGLHERYSEVDGSE